MRPTAANSIGRLVNVSRLACGLAARTYQLHQLYHRPRGDLAAVHVLGVEAAPAPLVLQHVKAVLAIAAITTELADGFEVVAGVVTSTVYFPHLRVVLHLVVRQRQQQMLVLLLALLRGRHRKIDPSAQHHDAGRAAPGTQAQLVLDRLPVLAGLARVSPVLASELKLGAFSS